MMGLDGRTPGDGPTPGFRPFGPCGQERVKGVGEAPLHPLQLAQVSGGVGVAEAAKKPIVEGVLVDPAMMIRDTARAAKCRPFAPNPRRVFPRLPRRAGQDAARDAVALKPRLFVRADVDADVSASMAAVVAEAARAHDPLPICRVAT